MATSAQPTRGVDSARRVLQILLQFSESRPQTTIDEVARLHSISIPSAYRYMALLREMYLIEERSRGVYVLSPQIIRLANASEKSLDLAAVSKPILEHLMEETHETALVVKRLQDAVVCVAVAEPDKSLSISFQPGYIMPLHRGAVAKMLLATTPKRKQQSLIAKIRPALSPQESADLIIALEKIRKENFAESESEVDKGVWAVAAPIVVSNRVIASVSVAAPTFHVDENARQSIRAKVSQAALDIADAIASSEIDLT